MGLLHHGHTDANGVEQAYYRGDMATWAPIMGFSIFSE